MTEAEYKDPWLLVARLNLFICAPTGRNTDWMARQNIGDAFFGRTPQQAVFNAAKALDDPAHDL